MLHEITERLTAAEFREYEIVVLEEIIISYLDERKEISENYGDLLGPPKQKRISLRITLKLSGCMGLPCHTGQPGMRAVTA